MTLEEMVDRRVQLFERVADGAATPEERAEFKRLTEVLRRLSPRITDEDIAQTRAMLDEYVDPSYWARLGAMLNSLPKLGDDSDEPDFPPLI